MEEEAVEAETGGGRVVGVVGEKMADGLTESGEGFAVAVEVFAGAVGLEGAGDGRDDRLAVEIFGAGDAAPRLGAFGGCAQGIRSHTAAR